MNFRLVDRSSALLFASLLAVAACRGEDPGGTDTEGTTGGASSSGAESTTNQLPTTSEGTSTGNVDPSTTSGPGSSSSAETNDSCGFIDNCTEPGTTSSGGGQNGDACGSDAECLNGNCYESPLGMGQGVCSECDEDSDCQDAGTGLSCSIDLLSMQAACAPGEPGNQCMSEAGCMDGLFCEPVIDGLQGFLPNACSECATTADCTDPQLCSPVFDLAAGGGQKTCVDPGSVANDALCPEDEMEGDLACMSGHCATVDVMGFIQVPVCGECETDMDCMMGETCMPGAFDINNMGFSGSTCV